MGKSNKFHVFLCSFLSELAVQSRVGVDTVQSKSAVVVIIYSIMSFHSEQ